MIIRYYKNDELAYTNRKRYRNISQFSYIEEEQRSVLLGDGANTQIKTNKNNICNYVTIDDTRWYVISYFYMNGSQVTLNLQRDVIGEFGISRCYGKIDRGYTTGKLRNRKELSVNQTLKDRIRLIPDNDTENGWTVSTHDNEKWGIIYLAKPQTDEQKVSVNIPGLSLPISNIPYVDSGTGYTKGIPVTKLEIYVSLYFGDNNKGVRFVKVEFYEDFTYKIIENNEVEDDYPENIKVKTDYSSITFRGNEGKEYCNKIISVMCDRISYRQMTDDTYTFQVAKTSQIENESVVNAYDNRYDGKIIKRGNEFIKFSIRTYYDVKNYKTTSNLDTFYNDTFQQSGDYRFTIPDGSGYTATFSKGEYNDFIRCESYTHRYKVILSNSTVPASDINEMEIDTGVNFIDEPYAIFAIPLFDCTISNTTEGTYIIRVNEAFNIFNTIISKLSGGTSPLLVDAQIYPYMPDLTSVNFVSNGIPLFNISSTTYERTCTISLFPYLDIKKEYISREYSIISPDQTDKFSFNFYDYINRIEVDDNIVGKNKAKISFVIKTSLKPFAILTSCVIVRDNDSLIGIRYESDIKGCQPSSNGFECSISSNAFETYKRENSNYQAIFNMQRESLEKQHEVERKNEKASAVMNTITATTMGAIAGASLGQVAGGKIGAGIGAAAGAAISGATVGIAMNEQYKANEDLRDYELKLQQNTFDLNIGTIKNLPNSISRISSFNEIILRDFWFVVETYECTEEELALIDDFIAQYGYELGVYGFLSNFYKNKWFIKANIIKSSYPVNLHAIASKELNGGIYIYE